MTRDLFHRENEGNKRVPLADRLRPKQLDEIVGQDDALGPGSFLRLAIERDAIPERPECRTTTGRTHTQRQYTTHMCKL